jgi:hypothetical protein
MKSLKEIISSIENRNFQDLTILNHLLSQNVQAVKCIGKVWTGILQRGFFKITKLQKFLKFQIEFTFSQLLLNLDSDQEIAQISIIKFLEIASCKEYAHKNLDLFAKILQCSREIVDFFLVQEFDVKKFFKFLKDFNSENHKYFENSFYILKNFKVQEDLKFQYSDAWASLLQQEMDFKTQKKVLKELPLEKLQDPRIAADFFIDSLKSRGVLGILALDGIFLLVTRFDLEYSDFYQQLYLLLDEGVLHSKYKSRFFSLTEKFLSSSLLPVNLVAAFIKKLARLALLAPPTAITFVLPIIYNLLRSHHKCITMIHKPSIEKLVAIETWKENEDAVQSCALDSSLWELSTLERHYHFQIKDQVSKFSSPLLSNQKVENFLYESFDSFALKTSGETKIAVDINLSDLIF